MFLWQSLFLDGQSSGAKQLLKKQLNIVPLRSTGQNLSGFFVVLLRKIFPQKNYLNSAVYRNVSKQYSKLSVRLLRLPKVV